MIAILEEKRDAKSRSIKRNLSHSFSNLIEGIRSRASSSLLFSRAATPTRSKKVLDGTKATKPIKSSSSKTLSLCSLNLCEANKKKKKSPRKKETNKQKKVHLSEKLEPKPKGKTYEVNK